MDQPTPLEFLLVSRDYDTLKTIDAALKRIEANLSCMSTIVSASDYVSRRKLDGIIMDFEMDDAAELIASIRSGASNRQAAIFACVSGRIQSKAAVEAGASVVLKKPLTLESVVSQLLLAKPMMDREQRRYFRHQLVLPVMLRARQTEQHATMMNLSQTGMAVRVSSGFECASIVDFSFQLPLGPSISGKGQIAWANSDGMMGIGFQVLRNQGKCELERWLSGCH